MLDALALAEDFEKAGLGREQASKMAAAIASRLRQDMIATKADLAVLKAELITEMEKLRSELRAELHSTIATLAWRIFLGLILQGGFMLAAIRFFYPAGRIAGVP